MLKLNGVYLSPAHITAARWQVYTNLPPKLFVYLADGRHESFEGDAAEAVLAWLDAHAEDLLAWQRDRRAVYGEAVVPISACELDGHEFGLDLWCRRPGCKTFRRDWERQQGDREQRESLATVRRVAASCE